MNPKIEDFVAKIENRRIIKKYSAFDLRLPHRQYTERDMIEHELAQQMIEGDFRRHIKCQSAQHK